MSTINGGTFEYTNIETILSNEALQFDNITEVIFTPEELQTEKDLDIESCVFVGTTGAASFLGLAFSGTDPNTGNHFGYLFLLDDPDEVDLSEATENGRNLQPLSCTTAVNAGVALIRCPNGLAPELNDACISTAIALCNTDVDNAILAYNIAETAAKTVYFAVVAKLTQLKIKKYQKALLICTLVGVLTGPLSFALCIARLVLIAEAAFYAAKAIAKSLLDEAIALAIEQRDRIIAGVVAVADAAGRACGSCPTKAPTKAPKNAATKSPTKLPTTFPTKSPSNAPTNTPMTVPTNPDPTSSPNPNTSPHSIGPSIVKT